ncbi:MAG: hypothetical protein ACLSGS_03530 [Adlercreutzia sp.]
MAEIAHEVGAYLMVDMATSRASWPRGCTRARCPTPTSSPPRATRPCAAPRGSFILTNSDELGQKINKAIFPGAQGGPLMHVIAGKAVAFGEHCAPITASIWSTWWRTAAPSARV